MFATVQERLVDRAQNNKKEEDIEQSIDEVGDEKLPLPRAQDVIRLPGERNAAPVCRAGLTADAKMPTAGHAAERDIEYDRE